MTIIIIIAALAYICSRGASPEQWQAAERWGKTWGWRLFIVGCVLWAPILIELAVSGLPAPP